MSKLLIVESPTKAKTIKRFLKNKYSVVASSGHIRDLPKSQLGVDVENNFKPTYEIPQKASKNVKKVKDAFKGASEIYLATDEDREGEAIAYHIAYILSNMKGVKKKPSDFKRITFHEITQSAIESALKNPRSVDLNLVDAQQARRVLDRLVGYKLSPLLWKKVSFGLSAGRVQSVALKLIVDKERERDAFVSQTYFLINGEFVNGFKGSILANLYSINDKKIITKYKGEQKFLITKEKQAKEHLEKIKAQQYSIIDKQTKDKNRYSYPPYTTSTLQQAASNILGFSANRTMRAAQKLYENGYITYHRTDSVALSSKFIGMAQKHIEQNFGKNYFEPKKFKNKSKNAQEAHEAIRPTSVKRLSEDINAKPDELVVYELIYARALASLMPPIKTITTTLKIQSNDKVYLFTSTGSQLVFEGWSKAYSLLKKVKYSPLSQDNILPSVEVNTALKNKKASIEKKETMPPARYTEASLIKTLEKYGIGRPSTYAPTISTIISRKYVQKDGRALFPTDLGKVVTKLLEDNFSNIIDLHFTANVEDDLDKIAMGKNKWEGVVKSFYTPFNKTLQKAEDEIKRKDYTVLGKAPKQIKCPTCGGQMVIKLGRQGRFYSCKKFPECKGIMSIDGETEESIAKKVNTKEFKNTYKEAPKADDGTPYILKKGKYGLFWAHPNYPKVKDAKPLEYKKQALVKLYGQPPKTDKGKDFVFRQGRFGKFWAHPDYPKVKKTVRIKEPKTT